MMMTPLVYLMTMPSYDGTRTVWYQYAGGNTLPLFRLAELKKRTGPTILTFCGQDSTTGGAAACAGGRCGAAEATPAVSRRRRSVGSDHWRSLWRGGAATAAAAPASGGGGDGAPAGVDQAPSYPEANKMEVAQLSQR